MTTRPVVLALALVALATSSSQALDQVRTTDNQIISGTIKSISRSEVTIENVRKEEEKVPVNKIDSVRYDGEPPRLNLVRGSIQGANYDAALRTIDDESLDPSKVTRLEIKQDIEFYKALAQARLAETGGDMDAKKAAGAAMAAFVTEHTGSWHFYEATEAVGDLLVAIGEPAKALEHYEKLAQAPWTDYKMRGAVLKGRALEAQGDHAGALRSYDDALARGQSAGDDPLIAVQNLAATLGRASCLAATDQAAEGIKLVEDVISKASPEEIELHARAYLTLGNCQLKAGNQKDALLAFLHVDVLYYAYPQYHAEALYHLKDLWKVVGQPQRGVAAGQTLATRYKGSPWASK